MCLISLSSPGHPRAGSDGWGVPEPGWNMSGDGVWRCPQTGDLYAEERGVLSEMRKR